MADHILQISGVKKSFKGYKAVDVKSVEVERHTIHALIGPNGAGKTTLQNIISGSLRPDAGSILLNGREIAGSAPHLMARLGMVRSFQISSGFWGMSVLDNVRCALVAKERGFWAFWRSAMSLSGHDAKAMELLAPVGLDRLANTLAGDLPYGKKRALELVCTLALEPELMLLDEPTQGMGHEDEGPMIELIREAAKGRTVLIVEHNMKVVESLCDRITVLRGGSVLAEGTYSEVRANPAVVEAYLGSAEASSQEAQAIRTAPEPKAHGANSLAASGAAVWLGKPIFGRQAPSKPKALDVSGLSAWYGEAQALRSIAFNANAGECVVLAGRNGAGRTTSLRSIMGLAKREGSVRVNGVEASKLASHQVAALGVGYCPEERGIFSELTCQENLLLLPKAGPAGMSLEEVYELFPPLLSRKDAPGTKLSGGEQQMLALGRILLAGAPLLLLDEISEGLAPVIVQTLAVAIGKLKARGYTIVLVEQNLRFAAPLADRIYVLEAGSVVLEATQAQYQECKTEIESLLEV